MGRPTSPALPKGTPLPRPARRRNPRRPPRRGRTRGSLRIPRRNPSRTRPRPRLTSPSPPSCRGRPPEHKGRVPEQDRRVVGLRTRPARGRGEAFRRLYPKGWRVVEGRKVRARRRAELREERRGSALRRAEGSHRVPLRRERVRGRSPRAERREAGPRRPA